MAEMLLFYILAGLICLTSLMAISCRSPITCAIYLVSTLFLISAIFAQLGADFIAAIQVLVYAGAIMVLFVFVIMLLNVEVELKKRLALSLPDVAVLLLSLLTFALVALKVLGGDAIDMNGEMSTESVVEAGGNTRVIGLVLFSQYLWPFELASFLILLAIISSIVIAKKEKVAVHDSSS